MSARSAPTPARSSATPVSTSRQSISAKASGRSTPVGDSRRLTPTATRSPAAPREVDRATPARAPAHTTPSLTSTPTRSRASPAHDEEQPLWPSATVLLGKPLEHGEIQQCYYVDDDNQRCPKTMGREKTKRVERNLKLLSLRPAQQVLDEDEYPDQLADLLLCSRLVKPKKVKQDNATGLEAQVEGNTSDRQDEDRAHTPVEDLREQRGHVAPEHREGVVSMLRDRLAKYVNSPEEDNDGSGNADEEDDAKSKLEPPPQIQTVRHHQTPPSRQDIQNALRRSFDRPMQAIPHNTRASSAPVVSRAATADVERRGNRSTHHADITFEAAAQHTTPLGAVAPQPATRATEGPHATEGPLATEAPLAPDIHQIQPAAADLPAATPPIRQRASGWCWSIFTHVSVAVVAVLALLLWLINQPDTDARP